jgi:hypothetical protein
MNKSAIASTSSSPIALKKSVAILSAPSALPEHNQRIACYTSLRVAFVFEVSRLFKVWSANVVSVMSLKSATALG